MFDRIRADIKAIREHDPAARSSAEVFFLYSGFHAILYHRLSNFLFRHKRFFLARWVSQHARRRTGIEIHPAAKIGRGVFIDHGMGVVIGETTEIGDNVTMYHDITLGGTTVFDKNGKVTAKRHPTIGNNVIIGSGAQVLGPIKIGNNAKIGSNAIVVKEVPANTTVIGMAAHKVQELSRKEAQKFCAYGIDASHPDPMEERFEKLCRELENVKKELAELKKEKKNDAQ